MGISICIAHTGYGLPERLMRRITVKKADKQISVFVGEVDQSGQYKVLHLTEAEAALVFMHLKNLLNQE